MGDLRWLLETGVWSSIWNGIQQILSRLLVHEQRFGGPCLTQGVLKSLNIVNTLIQSHSGSITSRECWVKSANDFRFGELVNLCVAVERTRLVRIVVSEILTETFLDILKARYISR
jgi:hypothetical protein